MIRANQRRKLKIGFSRFWGCCLMQFVKKCFCLTVKIVFFLTQYTLNVCRDVIKVTSCDSIRFEIEKNLSDRDARLEAAKLIRFVGFAMDFVGGKKLQKFVKMSINKLRFSLRWLRVNVKNSRDFKCACNYAFVISCEICILSWIIRFLWKNVHILGIISKIQEFTFGVEF